MKRLAVIAGAGVAAAAILAIPGLWSGYGQFVAAAIAYTAIAVLAVSALAGLTGIWSLGHSAFVALGAYMAANLAAMGVPLELIVPAAFLSAGVLGYLLGLFAGRFSILYFGLLTMALCLVAIEVIEHAVSLTGGESGLAVTPPRIALLGIDAGLKAAPFVAIALATLAFLLMAAVSGSYTGRKWRAVKSQRVAATALGIRPPLENAAAFALSAAIASLSGIGIALAIGFLDPGSFDLDATVTLIVATVVGGPGSLLGALVGAAFIVAVPEASRNVPLVAGFTFGVVTAGMLLLLRRGIVPSAAAYLARLRQASLRTRPAPAAPVLAQDRSAEAIAALVRRLLPPAERDLIVQGISLNFGGVRALEAISLTVPAGRTTGLIGPNGAGKTSFLNVLSGFYRASAGSARLGATDLLALGTSGRLRAGLGRSFQHAELFGELPLRDIVRLAARRGAANRRAHGLPPAAPDDVAAHILAGLGLAAWADHLPGDLPFGIQKVADIARLLATGTSIILLDEPFAGLDRAERAAIRTILQGMRDAGVSILIIDHAVEEVMGLSDHAVVFEFGRLIVQGPPQEVRRHPEVLRAYFGTADAPGMIPALVPPP